MNADVLPQARDLVLHLQLAALEFGNQQIVAGWMHLGFADLLFERPMLFFELRKVRLNGHARFLPYVESMPPPCPPSGCGKGGWVGTQILHQFGRKSRPSAGCAAQ